MSRMGKMYAAREVGKSLTAQEKALLTKKEVIKSNKEEKPLKFDHKFVKKA